MRKLQSLLLFFTLTPSFSLAQTEGLPGSCLNCTEQNKSSANQLAKDALAITNKNTACAEFSPEQAKKGLERAKKIDPERYKIVRELATYNSRSALAVKYSLDNLKLNPKEAAYLAVPEDLQKKEVEFVVLAHHQVPGEESGFDGKWDKNPGNTSVQILAEENGKLDWHYWNGEASGEFGSKFAEVSGAFEWENLYEWHKEGHSTIAGTSSAKALHPLAIRIASTGTDVVHVGQIEMKTTSDAKLTYDETIFSKGTSFPDYANQKFMKFGGGQNFQGKFPGALVLNGPSSAKIPEGWARTSNSIRIPLQAEKEIVSVEIALGDSHPDGITNSDGGTGTKGWAKLNVGIESGTKSEQWVSNENIAPEGLTYASPKNCTQVIQKGDQLWIQVSGDTAYIMGIRIGYK